MKALKSLTVALAVAYVLAGCKKDDPDPGSNNGGTNNAPAPTIASITPTDGKVGEKVVITGTNFSSVKAENRIRFGTVEAVTDSASATRLVTRVPKDANNGKVSVEVKGKSVSFATEFSVAQEAPGFSAPVPGGSANTAETVTATEAVVSTSIDKEGSKSVIQHGHVWSRTTAVPSLEQHDGKTELGKIPDNTTFPYKFTGELKNLYANTTYHVRAYVTTSQGTTYGGVSQVKSLGSCRVESIGNIKITYDGMGNMTRIGTDHEFTYNDEGFLTTYHTETSPGSTLTETYEYSGGVLGKKQQKRVIGTFIDQTTNTTYQYDGQGKMEREILVWTDELNTSRTTTIVYSYSAGVLMSVTSTEVGKSYTVQNGKIVKEGTETNYQNYEFNSIGDLIKITSYINGKEDSNETFRYDNKPGFHWMLLSFKGWTNELVRGSGITAVGMRKSHHNCEEKFSKHANGATIKTTRTYTYQDNRVTGVTERLQSSTMQQELVSNIALSYSGDCK